MNADGLRSSLQTLIISQMYQKWLGDIIPGSSGTAP